MWQALKVTGKNVCFTFGPRLKGSILSTSTLKHLHSGKRYLHILHVLQNKSSKARSKHEYVTADVFTSRIPFMPGVSLTNHFLYHTLIMTPTSSRPQLKAVSFLNDERVSVSPNVLITSGTNVPSLP